MNNMFLAYFSLCILIIFTTTGMFVVFCCVESLWCEYIIMSLSFISLVVQFLWTFVRAGASNKGGVKSAVFYL